MNRLTSFKGINTQTGVAQPMSLSRFAKIKPSTSSPISAPMGRGYGLPIMRHGQTYRSAYLTPGTAAKIALSQPSGVSLGRAATQFLSARNYSESKAESKLKEDLSKLVDDEIRNIVQFEKESVYAELGEEFLSRSGMKLTESEEDGKLVLFGSKGNVSYKVTFNREADIEENEPYEEEEPYLDEDEEDEDLDETPEDNVEQHKQYLGIEITYSSRTGKSKGQLRVEGFAGKDNRLYIESMSITREGEPKQPRIYFADLSDDMQDRIYEYLEEFHLDDSMAQFVKQQVARERSAEDIEFLKEFKNLIA